MIDEYEKMVQIRNNSEKIIQDTKKKTEDLEEFVGSLAAEFLQKATPNLLAEIKEQAGQAIAEIKNKDEELNKSIGLMKKLESLDLTLTPTICRERGGIYLKQGNYEKAFENYDAGVKLKENDADLLFGRALALHNSQKFAEAIKDYELVVKLMPKHQASYSNLGTCYRETGDSVKALANFGQSIKIKPSEYALLQRAATYKMLNKDDLAIADYEEAIKLFPKSKTPLSKLAMLYGKKGNYSLSNEYYLRISKLDPNPSISDRLNLSESYICIKDYNTAENILTELQSEIKETRYAVMAQYLLVATLILSGKNHQAQCSKLLKLVEEESDFSVGNWSFDEIQGCLNDREISRDKAILINKIISVLSKEIKPEEVQC